MSGQPKPDIRTLKKELQRAIFNGNGPSAADFWGAVYQAEPSFCFPPGVHYDLCRLLCRTGRTLEAVSAFEVLLARYPEAPVTIPARLDFARLCVHAPEYAPRGAQLLAEFLAKDPPAEQRAEAQRLMDQIQTILRGGGAPPPPPVAPFPQSGAAPTQPVAPPQVFTGFAPPPIAPPPPPSAPRPSLVDPFAQPPAPPRLPASMGPRSAPAAPVTSGGESMVSMPSIGADAPAAPPEPAFPSLREPSPVFPPPSAPSLIPPSPDRLNVESAPVFPPSIPPPVPPACPPSAPGSEGGESRVSFPSLYDPASLAAGITPSSPASPMESLPPAPPSGPPAGFDANWLGSAAGPVPPAPPAAIEWNPPAAPPAALPPESAEDSLKPPPPAAKAPAQEEEAPPEAEVATMYSPSASGAPPRKRPAAPEEDRQDFDDATRFLEKKKLVEDQETRRKAQEYEARLERSRFSAILPFGKRIHFAEISERLASHLGIELSAAKKRIRAGKGLLLTDLTYDEMVDFYRSLLDCPQKVLFILQSDDVDYPEVQEVLSAKPAERHMRATTARAQFRVAWDSVLFISAGKVRIPAQGPEPFLLVDLFCNAPLRHLRLCENTFSFQSWGGAPGASPHERLKNVALAIQEKSALSVASHTLELLRKKDRTDMQVFESIAEYEKYNRWLLLCHLGETIDPARRRAKAATNF